ncbi:hypothetical protein GCM10009850_006720 [Nonomuraea monospora]|uniref:Uncharacterized protein n=1 Tax=Nonomuraea monospora TaxID=568818 RepID=A0ABN3C7D2_9ACTN
MARQVATTPRPAAEATIEQVTGVMVGNGQLAGITEAQARTSAPTTAVAPSTANGPTATCS